MINNNNNILEQSVQYLKAVGPKRADLFKKIGIRTIRDLLFYFPFKHLDRSTILSAARAYQYVLNGYEGEVTVIGVVQNKEKIRYGKKEIFKVHLKDKSGFFECVWFQGIKYFYNNFNQGDTFAISAKPSLSKYNNLQFVHPNFDKISADESNEFINTGKIIPFYKIPKELRSNYLGDLSLRKIINFAVDSYCDFIEETLPENILGKYNLLHLNISVRNYHFPESQKMLNESIRRLKFEEIFYLEILIASKKNQIKTKWKKIPYKIQSFLVPKFLETLPFELTKAQLKVLSEIKKDLFSQTPMNRLLQGDVGSGKTIVALIAMLLAVDNGYQAVFMAPTEILAMQHAKNFSNYMQKLNSCYPDREVKVCLLIGGQKKSVKDKNYDKILTQQADLIIGTHALFEENVMFKNLGLVVVDEQHRFGVEQRSKLINKGNMPDVLVMSATPIPRTLTMTVYGDLDVSIINQLPSNRKPIKTVIRSEDSLPDIYKFIIDKTKEGYQSFIVYPLVEESEKLELKSALTHFEELSTSYFKNIKVGLIHGKMSWDEKEEVMFKFNNKEFDVLISTTVIEVGIDIQNANIMLINDAHRFGLSQLHQLRGRVGRGDKPAYCILVTKNHIVNSGRFKNINLEFSSPAELEKYKSSIRLKAMEKYTDGFKIAEIDFKLRGPGNIFGIEQSGFPKLNFINLITDSELILSAKEEAFQIISTDPLLLKGENNIIKNNLLKYHSDKINYAKIG